MKVYFILTTILCCIMLVLPFVPKVILRTEKNETVTTELSQNETAEQPQDEIRVLRTSSGTVAQVSKFDYLVGAVAGEMPASFCAEALKAQAVACYTYARWIKENSDSLTDTADISDSSSLHQKYIDKSEQKEKWKDDYEENRKIIEDAVRSVYGEYLAFEDETAMTVFHAISSGKTKSAAEVWGENISYLQAVEAPGDELSEKYESILDFSAEEFRELFSKAENITLEEDERKWACIKEKDSDGYIKTLTVGGKDFTAREVRKILDLPGNSFKATLNNGTFFFTVHGKGHGIGMSQYSADYLARQGKSYKEILAHFYKGTHIVKE